MLIDSNNVLVEAEIKGAAINGEPVGLTSLTLPGKFGCVPVYFSATADIAGGEKLAVKLQQADSEKGNYADVPGSTFEVTLNELKACAKGSRVGIKWLPRGVVKPWVKMVVTPTGTFTAGRIFAAITREDDDGYEPGLYIKDGRVLA